MGIQHFFTWLRIDIWQIWRIHSPPPHIRWHSFISRNSQPWWDSSWHLKTPPWKIWHATSKSHLWNKKRKHFPTHPSSVFGFHVTFRGQNTWKQFTWQNIQVGKIFTDFLWQNILKLGETIQLNYYIHINTPTVMITIYRSGQISSRPHTTSPLYFRET